MKVYELARELKIESKALLAKLKLWGIHVTNHMASLDEKTVAQIRVRIKKGDEPPQEKKKSILIKKKAPSLSQEATSLEEGAGESDQGAVARIGMSEKGGPSEGHEEGQPREATSQTVRSVSGGGASPLPEQHTGNGHGPAIPQKIAKPGEEPQKLGSFSATVSKEEKKGREKEAKTLADKKNKISKLGKDRNRKSDRLLLLGQEDALEQEEPTDGAEPSTGLTPPVLRPVPPVSPQATIRPGILPGMPPRETSRPLPGKAPVMRRGGAAGHRRKERSVETSAVSVAEGTKTRKKSIKIAEGISVKEYADRLGVKVQEVIMKLMGMGVMATINQPIDPDAAVLLAESMGITVEVQSEESEDELLGQIAETEGVMITRPPVVTIMGHTDHGKTTLLDAIRKSKIAEAEAGGITQHIGAYTVTENGRDITFLDTPGHEAFTAMRARGAQVTDVVVLVVAADDGVMPQTIEAINHARAANVPIVVALNKVDKPEANPDRVMQELSSLGLLPESWGGETIYCPVSAKKRTGLDHLLEMILLQADVLDLKANPDRRAQGVVIESKLDRGRGPVATILVQKGTLKVGDFIVVGGHFGRVRSLINDRGHRVQAVTPSFPAEVIGLDGVPQAGEAFVVVEDEKSGRQVAQNRLLKQRSAQMLRQKRVSLEEFYSQIHEGETKELNLILKVDVQGSLEPIRHALGKLATAQVRVRFIHEGVGGIRETDVLLAKASNAIILGFNVRPDSNAAALAEKEKIDIRFYSVIYDAVDDIRKAMEGLLAPTIREKVLGHAEVRQVYNISKVGTVAGCYVVDGLIQKAGTSVRLLRDSVVVHTGKISQLKRFKDDVKEVAAGYECGISLENFQDIKNSDIFECFTEEKIAAKLEG
jgi:translation initiation factor IF-2